MKDFYRFGYVLGLDQVIRVERQYKLGARNSDASVTRGRKATVGLLDQTMSSGRLSMTLSVFGSVDPSSTTITSQPAGTLGPSGHFRAAYRRR